MHQCRCHAFPWAWWVQILSSTLGVKSSLDGVPPPWKASHLLRAMVAILRLQFSSAMEKRLERLIQIVIFEFCPVSKCFSAEHKNAPHVWIHPEDDNFTDCEVGNHCKSTKHHIWIIVIIRYCLLLYQLHYESSNDQTYCKLSWPHNKLLEGPQQRLGGESSQQADTIPSARYTLIQCMRLWPASITLTEHKT